MSDFEDVPAPASDARLDYPFYSLVLNQLQGDYSVVNTATPGFRQMAMADLVIYQTRDDAVVVKNRYGRQFREGHTKPTSRTY